MANKHQTYVKYLKFWDASRRKNLASVESSLSKTMRPNPIFFVPDAGSCVREIPGATYTNECFIALTVITDVQASLTFLTHKSRGCFFKATLTLAFCISYVYTSGIILHQKKQGSSWPRILGRSDFSLQKS